MRSRYQEYVASFTYEASRLMKAIRAVQALESNLPGTFPDPDCISVGRKPYDLKLEWEAANSRQQESLKAHIVNNLQLHGAKWNKARDQALICSTRIKVGGKDTMNIRLRIALAGMAPQSS